MPEAASLSDCTFTEPYHIEFDIIRGMKYPGVEAVLKEVNAILGVFGLRPNAIIGKIVYLVLAVLFIMVAVLCPYKLFHEAFPEKVKTFAVTTSVYLRDYPADRNIINLDNIGTLRPWGGSFGNPVPLRQIVLALNTPISVLSNLMAPVSNGAAYYYVKEPDKRDLFTFDLTTQKNHVVKSQGRSFLVTLINIRNLSNNPDNKYDINFEYQFAVKEIW